MAIRFGTAYRNAVLDQFETTVGTLAVLKLFTGDAPSNCAAANSGTQLVSITLPSDWASAASSGAKEKSGVWSDTSADASGTIGHFRVYDSTATTCHMQGSAGLTGDLVTGSAETVVGQTVTIVTFTLVARGS